VTFNSIRSSLTEAFLHYLAFAPSYLRILYPVK
jgi:hypothetical protein